MKPEGTTETATHPTNAEGTPMKIQEVALDQLLVTRFKNGDATAFNTIVARHWSRIYSMVHNLLRNPQDSEEVTQDAFIRAHRALDKFRGDSTLTTWLHQIAINLARNRYWYWWRRKRHHTASLDQPLNPDTATPLSEIIAADTASPDDIAISQEFLNQIALGMEKLNPRHREILILRNVKNLPYEKIADILQLSVGTVKSRIARARENLRATINADFK
jgi:RNA polymerase sigma-70 factor (ECF subfamily)